ncbi:hypothetical protein [Burkholderia ubonensis]|uniref:hypothetical protein n=1 Tax=Burkholderia ubonensis TaxID=101571 RepID=UPI000A8B1D2C|nr:hypothetical protein [Burkholderia ubonensis]
MTSSASDSYLVILNNIHSTNRKIEFFTKEQAFFSTIISTLEGRYGYLEDAIIDTKSKIDELLKSLKTDLIDLKNQKASRESSNDFSEVESKFNDAKKIENKIKADAKEACKNIFHRWNALSHPSLDPMKWIHHWVEEAAKDHGVNANARTKISISYREFDVNSDHGNLYPNTIPNQKQFTLYDIATNRYRLDSAIRNAKFGTVNIHWDKSYPEAFKDKLLSSTLESDHEAALTRHINTPGTMNYISDYLQSEMIATAWEYLKDQNRGQQYQRLVRDFLSSKTGAKEVYVDGKILDRLFLIQSNDNHTNGTWGVLLSLSNKNSSFLELPKSHPERVKVIKQNDEWLRNHLSFSDRRDTIFIEELCYNPTPFDTIAQNCSKRILLSTPKTAAAEYTLNEAANNITRNLISTVRSSIDYMTTTNAELWVDWIGNFATFVGIVATLALVPPSILGAPHMVAASLLTAATTSVLPNIAKIVVHKDAATQNSAVKEIIASITLEAIGFGISKSVVRIGTGIAKSATQKLGQEAAELFSTEIRTSIAAAIGKNPLKLTPTSVGENLSDMLNFIDDSDIALEMVRNSTESTSSWKKFGLEITDRELDSFMLKWGNHNALKAGKIPGNSKLLIRMAETASSTGVKSAIDSNIDHGTRV